MCRKSAHTHASQSFISKIRVFFPILNTTCFLFIIKGIFWILISDIMKNTKISKTECLSSGWQRYSYKYTIKKYKLCWILEILQAVNNKINTQAIDMFWYNCHIQINIVGSIGSIRRNSAIENLRGTFSRHWLAWKIPGEPLIPNQWQKFGNVCSDIREGICNSNNRANNSAIRQKCKLIFLLPYPWPYRNQKAPPTTRDDLPHQPKQSGHFFKWCSLLRSF